MAGTKKDCRFVLMIGDRIRLPLNCPAIGTYLTCNPHFPLSQAPVPFPTQNSRALRHALTTYPYTTNSQGFLTRSSFLYLSLSYPKVYEDLFL